MTDDLAVSRHRIRGGIRWAKASGNGVLAARLECTLQALNRAVDAYASRHGKVAAVYQAQGRYADAELLLSRCLAVIETEHPNVGGSLNNLASLAFAQGDLAQAAEYWRRSTGVIQRRAQLRLTGGAEGSSKGEAQRLGWQFAGLVKTTQRLATQGRVGLEGPAWVPVLCHCPLTVREHRRTP